MSESILYLEVRKAFRSQEFWRPTIDELMIFIGIPTEFGRLPATHLTYLFLECPNRIYGIRHPNEHSWELSSDGILIKNAEGIITTRFNLLLSTKNQQVLVGEFLDGRVLHYLRPASHEKSPSLKVRP